MQRQKTRLNWVRADLCAMLLLLVAGAALSLVLSSGALTLFPVAWAHALPVGSDPPADAILQAPPAQVQMWFSEDLNPYTSRLVVVDPANREVDTGDSHVASDNTRELIVDLPLLPAGTYVVTWRTQSAADGHITAGSYIFRIARPDGSIPPLPRVLPTGRVPGAGGSGVQTGGTLDGPTTFQALATWLALLFMTFWVGGLIWQTWILTPLSGDGTRDTDLAQAARVAAARFSRWAPLALFLVLVANLGIVVGQSAALAGTWTGAFSLPLLRAVLFGSRFGLFWWFRQVVTVAALMLALASSRYGWALYRAGERDDVAHSGGAAAGATSPSEAAAVRDWRRELMRVFRDVRYLPARLAWGLRQRTRYGHLELLLGLALLVAFALSGHAAAVPDTIFAYALGVDLLHLLCEAAWVGGLLYISVMFLPALRVLTPWQRARVLALGLPEFSAVAIVCALLLAATGSLSTTIRLTTISQFLTTAYGRTLAIKIMLFLVMVAISAYHAFVLRPRLAAAVSAVSAVPVTDAPALHGQHSLLASAAPAETQVGSRSVRGDDVAPPSRQNTSETTDMQHVEDGAGTTDGARSETGPAPRRRMFALTNRLAEWLQREAILGVAVLVCVALLGAFAGSLTPASSATPANVSTSANTAFVATRQVSGYTITLKVTPVQFGPNTFTVTVKDGRSQPVQGASVLIELQSLDMDMGTEALQLKPMGNVAPGSYSIQTDLPMLGRWLCTVKLIVPGVTQPISSDFSFSIAYPSS